MYCNFRKVQKESRERMAGIDGLLLQKMMDSETENSKPIWVRISDWGDALNHMAPERPTGAGQIIRRDEPANKARFG